MRTLSAAGTLVGLALVVAACGGGGATLAPATAAPAATPAPVSAPPASDAPASAPASAARTASVAVGETPLGTILVGGDAGLTLYMFTVDADGTSACYDDCATAWPPLLTDGAPTVGEGLTPADFGTTARTDGTTQVTFKGMPLYFFQGDAAAGDTKGQGLNEKWYVLGADGTVIR
jgi:predicted lipoprotein with Yx(FWY)xxD motif